ncbi:MAG TPA: DUF2142 domain-containing protein [Ramlibacter sp.]|uniref:DUF2142 domain-containing protein n=1 Tax=Ramlibacter sp. TaxID=1917967 RepID=UPI002CEE0696|nr:DUF2142 domain-containing protein [Ramlibacter sp.]HVZ46409.1 DUF2142 domain-containing protein [Ramlibacter sp.]
MRRTGGAALWLVLVVLAACVSALVPPMQSPDENSHVLRADMLSRGQWLLETPPGGESGGTTDPVLHTFVAAYLEDIVAHQGRALTASHSELTRELRWTRDRAFRPAPGTGYYFPLAYLPHASGLALGRALELTVLQSYWLARLLCMGCIAALLVVAFRIHCPPLLAVALLLLPMTVFQMVLPTLDGITTALAVLGLSLFMRRMLEPGEGPSWEPWVLAGCMFLVATTRAQVAPLIGLQVYLAWRRGSRAHAVAGILAVIATLVWTGYAITHTVDLRVRRDHGTGELVRYYVEHPLEVVRLIGASLAQPDLARLYERSFIGVLGWLDTGLDAFWYPSLWGGLAVCLAVSLARAQLRQAADARLLLLGTAAASVLLAFFALLVTWTPFPAQSVGGVQGRYFIVPALALAYAAAGGEAKSADAAALSERWSRSSRSSRSLPALGAIFGAGALYALISALLARYHP